MNKMCGSGMKAAMLAHDLLLAGSAQIIVAGGMESMSNAPYLLDSARSGYRMGHRILDHMFLDGLEDAYDKGQADGHVRRRLRTKLHLHARGARRIRPHLARPQPEKGRAVVVIEKTLGHDLNSARALNHQVNAVFPENQVFCSLHQL